MNLENEYVGNKESCQRQNAEIDLHGMVGDGVGVGTEI